MTKQIRDAEGITDARDGFSVQLAMTEKEIRDELRYNRPRFLNILKKYIIKLFNREDVPIEIFLRTFLPGIKKDDKWRSIKKIEKYEKDNKLHIKAERQNQKKMIQQLFNDILKTENDIKFIAKYIELMKIYERGQDIALSASKYITFECT